MWRMTSKTWLWTTLVLCAFGFLKELRPSESFVTEYLVDFKNVTRDQIIHVAFPVSTYTSLGTLIVVFLVTDFLRYRPVLIFEGISYVITWSFLIWGRDLTAIIFVEFFYGLSCSTEVAYYAYIYAKVDKKHYKKVTSYTSCAILLGRFLSGVLAQILISSGLMDYHELNYISLVAVSGALLMTFLLPKADKSVYFNRKEDAKILRGKKDHSLLIAYELLWLDFKKAFFNGHILKWSLWWAVASAGQFQVITYIQALWERINENSQVTLYNGAVKATHTLLSAVFSFAVGYIHFSSWSHWSESLLSVISFLQGGLLVWMSVTDSLYQAYIAYIFFKLIHPVMITIASSEVAQRISDDSYGLVFGVLTFIALGIQTILTIVISDAKGLAMTEREQFFVYGLYFGTLGAVFLIVFIYSFFIKSRNIEETLTKKSLSTSKNESEKVFNKIEQNKIIFEETEMTKMLEPS